MLNFAHRFGVKAMSFSILAMRHCTSLWSRGFSLTRLISCKGEGQGSKPLATPRKRLIFDSVALFAGDNLQKAKDRDDSTLQLDRLFR